MLTNSKDGHIIKQMFNDFDSNFVGERENENICIHR